MAKGVELIPCIQTLAHLDALTRWPAYKPLWDTGCILLAGEEKVYALIEQMFATMSKCFSTRTLNVGMDEAHMLGRGKYYDRNGDVDHSQVFIDHLKRVAEIGAKYGYSLTIWSDMLFRLVTGGKYGISFDSFTQLDLPETPGKHIRASHNPEKYLLYNDCFTGLFDSTIAGGENEAYARQDRLLEPLKEDKEWGYLFATQHALCDVLSIKAELGVKTREAYADRDKEKLEALIADYKKLSQKLEVFHQVFMNQWFTENKPHGFDVQDIRLGGLMTRIKSCTNRLQALLDGKIDRIEELEEKQLDITGTGTEFTKTPADCNRWRLIATANII